VKLADLMPKGLLNDEQDAIALLEADHDKLLALFDQFEDIKQSRAHQEKQAIVADACHALSVHMAVEEGVFYPAVRGAVEDDDLMNEALVEHEGAKALIRDLERMDAGDGMFNAKFTVLAENVRHHVKEERDEMFPRVRATTIDLKALGRKLTARREELMKRNGGATPKSRPVRRRAQARDESRAAR
jgi:hemerythrin-like domain-containing protein